MSRIGKKEISLPEKVKVNVAADGAVTVEGPKGKLEWTLPKGIVAKVEEKSLAFTAETATRTSRAMHGLSRALVANMVAGVSQGFKRDLEIQGVGFKAAVQGTHLNLNIGKSHQVLFEIPKEVKVTVADNTKISVEGIDKQIVGQTAANIRAFYPPEPYKGKGIRYAGEQVRRKEGKTVQ
ncbi:MAG: 50S ribosomal protein L6 [Terrimicrobiaceae bacterium]|nr:50S ribosomal protein L6 [Terrimicrobiaceae bacterium]